MIRDKKGDRREVMFVLPSLGIGGAERQVVALVNGIDGRRFVRRMFVFERDLRLKEALSPEVTLLAGHRRARVDAKPVMEVARLYDEHGVDVAHCTLSLGALVGWAGARASRRRPRIIGAVHSTTNRGAWEELVERVLYSRVLARCDRVVFVCKAQKDVWVQKYPRLEPRSVVIYNGVDGDRFRPIGTQGEKISLRGAYGVGRDAFVIACPAAFRPEKGHMVLLDAFASMKRSGLNAVLLLAGDGSERARAERRSEVLGLKDSVLFLGVVEDIRSVIAASDVTVLPSTGETFSMAMLESMAMEVPVVASALGGMGEGIRSGETGLLVRAGSVGELAEALAYMAGHREEREVMGRKGRELVLERFTQAEMINRTEGLLAGVCA